jgi:hypothetical protein
VEFDRLRKSVRGLAQLTRLFSPPVVIWTLPGQDGSAAKLLPEISEQFGQVTVYRRTKPDTFLDPSLRRAIEGRRTLLVSAVATEVAVGLPSLYGAEPGYTVYLSGRVENLFHLGSWDASQTAILRT